MRAADYPPMSAMASAATACWPEKSELPTFCSNHLREGRLLLMLGIGKPLIARMMLLARDNGTSVEDELLASGEVAEDVYFEALARHVRLPFLPRIDTDRVHDLPGLDSQLRVPEMLRLFYPGRPAITVIVPTLAKLEAIAAVLAQRPALAQIMAVSTRSAVRRAIWKNGEQRRIRQTGNHLFEVAPHHSARIVLWGKQGFYTGLCLSGFVVSAAIWPLPWLVVVHLLLTLLFLGQLSLRGWALFHMRGPCTAAPPLPPQAAPLPVYSVFVALYREASVVAQLVGALDRLDWPRSRLDIKLICEEDDQETLDALAALRLGPSYEIVRVPVSEPRTKPKALSYALPGARGTYLTVYDAEDRPDPAQLREAYAAFQATGREVACLQAPLVVTNAEQGWISTMFALEYAGLFRGLLRFLSATDLPLPLGGTSNHFRMEALKAVGGWDPYNTTEDADLGLRLYRLGYRSRVIVRPTLEDAPTQWRIWFGQRTRWYKGWLQTWLVLMRAPASLLPQMGAKGFLAFQILIGGMILSALSHPLTLGFIVSSAWMLVQGRLAEDRMAFTLMVIDGLNIVGNYAVMIRLGRTAMSTHERRVIGWRWITVPAYCLLTSGAAWNAVVELYRSPFSWTKTQHSPVEAR